MFEEFEIFKDVLNEFIEIRVNRSNLRVYKQLKDVMKIV